MLRWIGGLSLGVVLAAALAVVLMFASAGVAPKAVAPEIAEARQAARAAQADRLWPLYQPRLPGPSGAFQIRHAPRGVMDGVAVVDFEIEREDIALPPLIIAVGGSGGGFWLGGPGWFPQSRPIGALLIRSGFSIRSIAHFGGEPLPEWFGEGQVPTHLAEGSLDAIAHVVRDARRTRGAARRCTGFLGVSKGGELTLLLAGYGSELAGDVGPLVDAAVAAVPSHVVLQSPHRTLRIRSSWSLGGEPLEFVRAPWLSPHIPGALMRDYEASLALSRQMLQDEAAVARAEIPVERAEMPVLMLGATRDHVWPSGEMARAALARADRLNPDHLVRLAEFDLDHFVMREPEPMFETVAFFYEVMRRAAAEGRCEADFADPWTPDDTPTSEFPSR